MWLVVLKRPLRAHLDYKPQLSVHTCIHTYCIDFKHFIYDSSMATCMFFGLQEEAEPTQTQEERADSTQEGSGCQWIQTFLL